MASTRKGSPGTEKNKTAALGEEESDHSSAFERRKQMRSKRRGERGRGRGTGGTDHG